MNENNKSKALRYFLFCLFAKLSYAIFFHYKNELNGFSYFITLGCFVPSFDLEKKLKKYPWRRAMYMLYNKHFAVPQKITMS